MTAYHSKYCPKCVVIMDTPFCVICGTQTKTTQVPICQKCGNPLASISDEIGAHASFCGKCGLRYEQAVVFQKPPKKSWLARIFRR